MLPYSCIGITRGTIGIQDERLATGLPLKSELSHATCTFLFLFCTQACKWRVLERSGICLIHPSNLCSRLLPFAPALLSPKKVEFADLPDWAPTYDVDVYFFWKLAYSERADSPSHIPKWFRDEAFIDDQDDDFSNVAAASSSTAVAATSGPSNQTTGKTSRRGSLVRRKLLRIPVRTPILSAGRE